MGMSSKQILMGLAALAVIGVAAGMVSGNLSFGDNNDDANKDDDLVGTIDLKVKDAQADSLTYVSTQYKVYNSDGIEVASGSTSSSSFTSIKDLNEGETYTVHVYDDDGSGDDYYHASKEVTVPENKETVIIEADKQGSLTTNVLEDSGSADDDGTIKVSQGQTETVTLELEESTADAVFNEPAVFVKTNDTDAVDNIEVQDASEVSEVPDRLSSYSDGYDLGTDQLVDFGSTQVDVQITRADDDTSEATVTLATADGDMFENNDGEWVFGYEDEAENNIRLGDNSDVITVSN